ncbi:hypothetical protein [uncultured Prevotella sp.]|uniref:hypothetical protein n=1 Tax=uncultured Prevotella sp. TaxID=159272 RepID=UPI00259959A8|nr:hypothetical protein [uncultured Prevotella sp.]
MKENANIKDYLREAIRHEEMARPSMPTDINERIMRRMEQETVRKKGQKRLRKLWPWLAAACVAAFILVYIAPPEKEVTESRSTAEITEAETPQKRLSTEMCSTEKRSTESRTKEMIAMAKPEKVITVKQKAHKVVTAKRDTISEKKEEDKVCDLAMAEKAEESQKPRTISESDLPITRPENLRYTPEEIALMKRLANEAYIKWVKLELEIAKYNIEQSAYNK